MLAYPFELKGLDLCKRSSYMNKPIFIASAPLENVILWIVGENKTHRHQQRNELEVRWRLNLRSRLT
jgi:hypothetical protein